MGIQEIQNDSPFKNLIQAVRGLNNNKLPAAIALWMTISSTFITPYMVAASFSYFLMILGLLSRKSRPRAHIGLMTSAIAIDLILVLTLEITRNAIRTAMSFELHPLQQAHIFVSSIATALYIPVVIYGIRKFRPSSDKVVTRLRHKYFGMSAFIFRTLGYFLMFSMLSPH